VTADFVSVIVPTYNRAYCLQNTLDSVFAQSHENLELVLVDDGSTDDTRALAELISTREPRLRYIYQANSGVSAARNRGLREARGEYLALLDSDDTWMLWKLEAQLACLKALPEVGMIWTDMEAVGAKGQVVSAAFLRTMYDAYRWFKPEELFAHARPLSSIMPTPPEFSGAVIVRWGDIFSQMLMGNLVHTSTVLMRRSRYQSVRNFDESMRTGEDYDFHLRTCRAGPVALLDAPAIRYQCGRPDQLSRNELMIQIARNFVLTVERAIERDRARVALPRWMIERSLASGHQWVGEAALEGGDLTEARTHLAASLRHNPMQPRTALVLASTFAPACFSRLLRKCWRTFKRAVSGATST
jgi:GT2 family glycosyltransferase